MTNIEINNFISSSRNPCDGLFHIPYCPTMYTFCIECDKDIKYNENTKQYSIVHGKHSVVKHDCCYAHRPQTIPLEKGSTTYCTKCNETIYFNTFYNRFLVHPFSEH